MWRHEITNNIDTKAKCRHLKKFTCKGTWRQVFIRVYGLVIQSVMLVFLTQLCELLPLLHFFWFAPPSLCEKNKYTRIQCVRVGICGVIEGRGPQTDKHLPQSPFTGKIFWDDDI
jgi:hypothetical protein